MKKRICCFIPLIVALIIAAFRVLNWFINFAITDNVKWNNIAWIIISTIICLAVPLMIALKKELTIKIALCISILLFVLQLLINILPYSVGRNVYIKSGYIPGCRFKSLIKSYPYKLYEVYRLEELIKENEDEYNKPVEYWEDTEKAQERKKNATKKINKLKEMIQEEMEKNKSKTSYFFLRIFDEGACLLLTILCLIISINLFRSLPKKEKNNNIACKNCGCRIVASWNYCRNCGNVLKLPSGES